MTAVLDRILPTGHSTTAYGAVAVTATLHESAADAETDTNGFLLSYWVPASASSTSTTWTIESSAADRKTIAKELSDAYVKFARSQVPLDERIAKAVSDNLWDLYAR